VEILSQPLTSCMAIYLDIEGKLLFSRSFTSTRRHFYKFSSLNIANKLNVLFIKRIGMPSYAVVEASSTNEFKDTLDT